MINSVEVKSLSKRYNKKKILDNISFRIEKGKTVAITGKSGKGKSTLLNIIGLIEDPSSGDVYINGQKMSKIQSKRSQVNRAFNLDYLFQNYALVDDESVEDNIFMALKSKKISRKQKIKLIDKSLESVGLKNREKDKVFNLSGGEQQRVAIARLVARGNNIVLADEPTGSLDSTTKKEILKVLEVIKKDKEKTFIVVTHDKEVADWCDEVISL